MARISLVEQYDNKDVIQQIYQLKTVTTGWDERIAASEQRANEALDTANAFEQDIRDVEASNTELSAKVDGFDTRISTAQQTADNAIGRVDTLDTQVTDRIADQEVTALDVASAGTGAYAVTAHKQNGNVTSNAFNVSKVTSATIGEGQLNNSIYLELHLSDGTTVRTNDTVIDITGVEADIHVTSIVLEDAPDAHTIKAIFTYNNGQSLSSNTLTYDYPDIASSSNPGLVKGNDAIGGVQVDGQGTMSVVGWNTLSTKEELSQAVTAVNGSIADANDRIDSIEDEIGSDGQAGTIRDEIALLKAKDTTLQGNIDAVDARCDNISSTVSDQGEMLSAQAAAIQQNTTAIQDKQDTLVAGENMDTVPTEGSTKPITSGAVYDMPKVFVTPVATARYEVAVGNAAIISPNMNLTLPEGLVEADIDTTLVVTVVNDEALQAYSDTDLLFSKYSWILEESGALNLYIELNDERTRGLVGTVSAYLTGTMKPSDSPVRSGIGILRLTDIVEDGRQGGIRSVMSASNKPKTGYLSVGSEWLTTQQVLATLRDEIKEVEDSEISHFEAHSQKITRLENAVGSMLTYQHHAGGLDTNAPEASSTYSDYPYVIKLFTGDVSTAVGIDIYLSPADAASGVYSPFVEVNPAYTSQVLLYAKENRALMAEWSGVITFPRSVS